jgi:hypothetical protein
MKKSLIEYFSELHDVRRKEGRRHSLEFVLIIVVMAIMSNYVGYRAFGDFAKRNKDSLIKHLKPKKPRVPSFLTIRKVLQSIDFKQLTDLFTQWSLQYVEIGKEDYFSIDGKSIRSTVSEYGGEFQNFVSIVSIFSQKSKQVLTQQKYQNKKESEIDVVLDLLEQLDLTGKTITLDALHCQKKL